METNSVSIVMAGSGGAGAISAATMLLEAAGRAHWYAYMTRSVGAQIRGGEAAAMLRFSKQPIQSHDDHFDILLALDWQNLGKFAAEMPLTAQSLIIGDPAQGDVPVEITASGARQAPLEMRKLAMDIPRGRPNMIAMGVIAGLVGLPLDALTAVIEDSIGPKGEAALVASKAALDVGLKAAASLGQGYALSPVKEIPTTPRWSLTGNEATGFGAVKGGIRFVAAYPITPATEVLEWMAPALNKVGGTLVQVEDELAAINQIIGASYGGIPSLTATAGPGLALMTESLGLSVASETPIVVIDVQRGGPSTGIPAKSEQTDLNIALYGLHGDAPHLVLAPNSVADCLLTTQWAVHLAETTQSLALVLSDQSIGQTRIILDKPADIDFQTRRLLADTPTGGQKYQRYAVTPSGVSPMAVPGTPGCQYTADGLEHNPKGTPSSSASDHQTQMDKRERKLTGYDYGDYWADLEGDLASDTAILTWGSSTGAVREALKKTTGKKPRLISVRLLSPVQPEKFAAALKGVSRVLIVEQSHGKQFYRYLRAHYDLPGQCQVLHRPGPLPFKPQEILEQLAAWEPA